MTTFRSGATADVVTIQTPARFSSLRLIRKAVAELCERSGLSEFKTSQLEMAADEACSNAIEHSYGGEAPSFQNAAHPGLTISLIRRERDVVVEITDRGTGFDFDGQPGTEPTRDFDASRQRGLGMFIIRRFVDTCSYERATPAGNVLRLTKNI